MVRLHGLDENVTCVVFTLNTCAPIGHAEVENNVLSLKCLNKIMFAIGAQLSKRKRNVGSLGRICT